MIFVGIRTGKRRWANAGEAGTRDRLTAGGHARLDPSHQYPGTVSPASHVLAIASGKGGAGRSTLAFNLSLALRDGGAQSDCSTQISTGLTSRSW